MQIKMRGHISLDKVEQFFKEMRQSKSRTVCVATFRCCSPAHLPPPCCRAPRKGVVVALGFLLRALSDEKDGRE